MWNPSPVVALSMRADAPLDRASPPTPDRQLTRAADVVRSLTELPRVNLLLVGVGRDLRQALEARLLDLGEPLVTWSPGGQLSFPASTQMGTLILHDVDALSDADQRRLLEWLGPAGRCVRVISTTSAHLFPRIEAGAFSDHLYYRLNTVTLEIGSNHEM